VRDLEDPATCTARYKAVVEAVLAFDNTEVDSDAEPIHDDDDEDEGTDEVDVIISSDMEFENQAGLDDEESTRSDDEPQLSPSVPSEHGSSSR